MAIEKIAEICHAELPVEQKAKDYIFGAVVRSAAKVFSQ
jgi:hypothetical protein